jgi:ribosomal protein L16/L10AE
VKIGLFSIFFKNINKVFWCEHRKRKRKRKRKKHLHFLFLSRKKKFVHHYLKFDSKKIKKNQKINYNLNLTQIIKTSKIGIKSINYHLIDQKPLRSLKFITERYLKAEKHKKKRRRQPALIKTRINIFPDYWLTSKSKGIRMGKGKGALKKKIFFLKKGDIICNLKLRKNSEKNLMHKKFFVLKISLFIFLLLNRLKNKLPVVNRSIYKKF